MYDDCSCMMIRTHKKHTHTRDTHVFVARTLVMFHGEMATAQCVAARHTMHVRSAINTGGHVQTHTHTDTKLLLGDDSYNSKQVTAHKQTLNQVTHIYRRYTGISVNSTQGIYTLYSHTHIPNHNR